MATERTPEEETRYDAERARVRAVLDEALENHASWANAEWMDLDPTACEQWVDKLWDGLRDNLDEEDRLLAIVMLLEPSGWTRAAQIRRSLGVR